MPNSDERREAAIEAAAKAMCGPSPRWEQTPEAIKWAMRTQVVAARAAYDATLGGAEVQEGLETAFGNAMEDMGALRGELDQARALLHKVANARREFHSSREGVEPILDQVEVAARSVLSEHPEPPKELRDWRCPDCGSGVTKVHMQVDGPRGCGKPPGYWSVEHPETGERKEALRRQFIRDGGLQLMSPNAAWEAGYLARAEAAEQELERLRKALTRIDNEVPSEEHWHRMGDSMWANIGRLAVKTARAALASPPDEGERG